MTVNIPQEFTWVEGKASAPPPIGKQDVPKKKRYEFGQAHPKRELINTYSKRTTAFFVASQRAQDEQGVVFYVLDTQARAGNAQLFTVFFSDVSKRVEITVVTHAK